MQKKKKHWGAMDLLVRNRAGDVIYQYRKENNVCQVKLSQELDITQGALSKIEAHIAPPTLAVWLSFCRLSGISVDILLDECSDETSTEDSLKLKKAA